MSIIIQHQSTQARDYETTTLTAAINQKLIQTNLSVSR
jgi:hypothetical protein